MYIDKIGEKISSINAHQRCTDGKVTSNCYQVYKVAKIINHFKSLIKKKSHFVLSITMIRKTLICIILQLSTHILLIREYIKLLFVLSRLFWQAFFYVLLKHHKIEFASFQQCEKLIAKNEHNV